jgi:DNA uptake protein ComE-like DNA-binding protein
MFWYDFFYFSNGNRQGLIFLLCVIAILIVVLVVTGKEGHDGNAVTDGVKAYASAGDSQKQDAANGSFDSFTRSDEKEPPFVSPGRERSSSDGALKSSQSSSSTKSFHPGTSEGNRSGSRTRFEENKIAGNVKNRKETVSERVKRITSSSRPSYPRIEKFKKGVVVELNTADTTILKKIPGIGSTYARRIVGYRNLLGGYYSVTQLSEVYGVDEDRYNAFAPWFTADPSLINKLPVNKLSLYSLRRNPYIDYNQAKILVQLRRQKEKLTGWENLQLLNEFADIDKIRLYYYLSFE